MYLKTIEIQGFKSFANKTVFQFHNGVTGIVGPNGSGKSNVADAVRWVLGEQRVKQLRGGSMQDVIFAGTENRRPLGYASVSITLDNGDHSLAVSYDEVTVTRRLYRSGESEYLLNGTQCRLKDIHELFYDTGIGKEGYSIIGQGQIEKILSGKPEERRELFDEAAGIVKFKRRKLEAQRKLEDEQQNLVRVNDILAELTRQLGPLERQSEKARVYLKKREELKAYDVNFFLAQFQEWKEKLEEVKKARDGAAQELETVKQKAERFRGQYDETTRALETLEERQRALQEKLTQGKLTNQQRCGRIDLLREQIRAAKQSDQQRKERSAFLAKEIEAKTKGLASLSQARGELEERRSSVGEADELSRREYEELSGQLEELARRIGAHKDEVLRLLTDRSSLKAKQQHFDTMLQQMDIRRSQIAGKLLKLRSDESDQAGALERLKQENEAIDLRIAQLNQMSEGAGRLLTERREKLTRESQELEREQQEYHRLSSRLETLRNIAERYDGYGSSIRRVMEKKNSEKGLLGVVADLIKTDKVYETAIETALGGSIQNIVTDNEETAKRMIAYLKTNRLGRATFLPLTAMRHAPSFGQKRALEEKGVVGLASELVRCDSQYEGLVRYLLGRTVVAQDIDSAIALAKSYQYSLRIVTLEGDLLTPGGSLSGGAFKNSSNLLGRRREIEELGRQVAAKQGRLKDLRRGIDTDRSAVDALRDQIRSVSEKLQSSYLEQNTARLRQREVEGHQGQTSRLFQELEGEQQQTCARIEQMTGERDQLLASLEESDRRQKEQEQLQTEAQKEYDRLLEKQKHMGEALEALHVELAQYQQKEEYLLQEQERFQEQVQELTREQRSLESDLGARRLAGEKEKEIASLEELIAGEKKEMASDEQALGQLAREREQKQAAQRGFFSKREELTERETLLDRECFRLNSQMEKLDEARENGITYMWEEYELTYSNALALKREDLGSRADWKKHMAALKKEIRELGSVNVNAIEEYQEVAERHSFLSSQHDDLIKAEQALQKIIRQLDEGMRTQFTAQFARIQEEFDKAFRQLFGGGQGSLELVDDEDILEAGIRIVAQPPGKKLQNMMQLSGGEKALTAIALLFAIQNLKPSPFCLLDEIEAALDENNVERYAGYLHKLTKHTQFIIITHRRGTMAAADRLYGVTMQEKGVSALVSVNLIEKDLES